MLRLPALPSLPLLIAALGLLHGCGEAITGAEVPNSAPDTMVTAAPPQATATGSVVTFYWDGFDPDGEIVGFEWRISNNGENGVVDPGDTLTANLPWNFTSGLDSTFSVSADLPGFPKDLEDSVSIRQIRSWQSHTFFVRAVDEDGLADPTPAISSFTSTTLTPNVVITVPTAVQPNTCSTAPPALAFAWDATDPDGEARQPEAIRYLLKKFGAAGEACLLQHEYESGAFPIHADDPDWSEWISYEAALDSGKVVRFPPRPASDVGTSYVFAVQARDFAGAVTPTFEWGRNVRHLKISSSRAPLLTVREPMLGVHEFINMNTSKRFIVASSQQISLSWDATAESYGNLVEAYRYGFNLTDPEDPDDVGWAVDWGNGPAWKRAAPRKLTSGSPNFIVQAIDTSNQVTRASFFFQVVETGRRAEQRRLLIVDDTPKEVLVPWSQNIDRQWDIAWRRLIEGIGVFGFGAGDMIDATDDAERLNFTLLNDYRAVIWHIGPGKTFYADELGPGSGNFNWLTVYQRDVGNLLFTGAGAMSNTLSTGGFWGSNTPYPIMYATGANTPRSDNIAYHSFCVSAIDMVRPVTIWGEAAGKPLRETKCSAIVYAGPTEEMLQEYESSAVNIPPLHPTDLRRYGSFKYNTLPGGSDPTELNTTWLSREEFYNVNVTSRNIVLTLRDCQVPMYRAIARRDVDAPEVFDHALAAGWTDMGLGLEPAIVDSTILSGSDPPRWVDDCISQTGRARRGTSVVSLQPIGIASSVFSGRSGNPPTKQEGTLLASDFLWGFNPIQFRSTGMRTVLRWMILEHWGVNEDF